MFEVVTYGVASVLVIALVTTATLVLERRLGSFHYAYAVAVLGATIVALGVALGTGYVSTAAFIGIALIVAAHYFIILPDNQGFGR